MALNLGKAVVDFLTAHPEEKFSARQIAEWLVATFPDECSAKKASSQALETDADLQQQLVAEIGSQRPRLQKKHPNLKTTEGRPRKYYVSEKSDSAEVAAAENVGVAAPVGKEVAKIGEHGLYPLLASYLWAEFEVYSKRIDEKRSSNKRGPNGNRWLAMLESGEAKSLKEIATREGIDNSYVSRMVNLTTLAPDIVAAILDDALPNHVTLFDLAVDPPALWDEQRARLTVGD